MKVAVCVPHYGPLRPGFVESLARLFAMTAGTDIQYNGEPTRPLIELFLEESGPLDYKRNRLVQRALAWGADYVQWIDNDHTFPPGAFFGLAQHGLPIVGANYAHRVGPPIPTAISYSSERVPTTQDKRGLVEEVASVGFGFCLMQAGVFSMVPKPWFSTNFTDDGEVLQSDDVHFSNQARSVGLKLYVDHDLSLEVGHIAERVIKLGETA